MDIQIINPIEYPNWDDLLLTNPVATFFHTAAWAKVLSESYYYKPLYFTIIENGQLSALIPIMEIKSFLTGKRGVSLPFTDHCHPISPDSEVARKLFEKVIDYGKKAGWKAMEFRGGQSLFKTQPYSSTFFTHTLNLTKDLKQIVKNFRPSTRRNIKKAEKNDVTVIRSNSLPSLREFYRLNCMTRKHHGLPPQPWYFFKNLFKNVISPEKGTIFLSSYKNKAIAAAIFFHFGNQAIYKYGASDRNHQHFRPNNLAMWQAIKWYTEKGFKSFNFGRTEPENQGLMQFKRGWGTKEETINYYEYDLALGCFITKESGLNRSYHLFRHVPPSLLRLTGNLLYRHVG
jgi:hypothetical protein